jgi:phosphoribosylformylglycinamidine cyclo-ligase
VVGRLKERVRATYRAEVIGDLGAFGGLFALDSSQYRHPVLVSAADGAGTKVVVAQQMRMHETIGIDLVAMSVNDVAAMGAEPLFFLDYIVVGQIDEEVVDSLVSGMAAGCKEAGCALIGGEIAEHPGHLSVDSYDLAGFCVGVVERDRILDGTSIGAGDIVLGIGSSGLHANGFSLVRRVLFEQLGHKLDDRLPGLVNSLGEELLTPTLIYSPVVAALTREVPVKGVAHVTGGGLPENLGRILPSGLSASIERESWDRPPIFDLVSSLGRIPEDEMFSTFNMGIGMVAVVDPPHTNRALDLIRSTGFRGYEIGSVAEGGQAPVTIR